jgi:flagellin
MAVNINSSSDALKSQLAYEKSTSGPERAVEQPAAQPRSTVDNVDLSISRENLVAAQSRVVDAEAAQETLAKARVGISQQAGSALLAQANQSPQAALQLLKE